MARATWKHHTCMNNLWNSWIGLLYVCFIYDQHVRYEIDETSIFYIALGMFHSRSTWQKHFWMVEAAWGLYACMIILEIIRLVSFRNEVIVQFRELELSKESGALFHYATHQFLKIFVNRLMIQFSMNFCCFLLFHIFMSYNITVYFLYALFSCLK